MVLGNGEETVLEEETLFIDLSPSTVDDVLDPIP